MDKNDKDFDGLCDLFGLDDQNNGDVLSEQLE